MSNQPTPETDAAAWVETNQANDLVLASFARNLERQRDAAISRFESSQHARMGLKRERDELQRTVQSHRGAVNIAIEALDRAITQRDEARELARELRDALERLSNHGHADDCFLINRADGQCDCGVEDAQTLLHRVKEVLP